MKAVWCLLLFGAAAGAQSSSNNAVVDRLNADLRVLESLPALRPGVVLPDVTAMTPEAREALRAAVANEFPEQDLAMQRYASDVMKTRGMSAVPWDLAYALTSVLRGRKLTDSELTDLNRAMLEAVDAAISWRATRRAARFQEAALQVHEIILGFGVTVGNARAVSVGLLKAASLIVNHGPLVQPISPAYPPTVPERF
jgi:hypothetical protein